MHDFHKFPLKDITIFAELDMIYTQLKVLQAKNDKSKTKCLGSGKCCRVGLMLPMLECANIAWNLIAEYFFKMEKGEDAELWITNHIVNLKSALYDESWDFGETDKYCAFFRTGEGCSIYKYRPAVCRAYGTIVGVDDFCPRNRNQYGYVDVYSGEGIKKIVHNFSGAIKRYEFDHPWDNYVVYMPVGVLKFLLNEDEMKKLSKITNKKFWEATNEYNTAFMRLLND